jgi:molecular chaperone GrpE
MPEENNPKQNSNKSGGGEETGGLKETLEKCEKEKSEYLAGWQRAKADFINYKKDELKRLEEVARYGNEELISELITVLDNFDLGLSALEKAGPVEKGVYMIRSQIDDILKKRGLEKIHIKTGELFDPAVSEVIAEAESDKPPGTVLEEIEPGYRLYDKILRPSRVKASKTTK